MESRAFQLTRPAKNATAYQESTDMITPSGRVCATVRGGVGLMGLCGAEAREFTCAARRADVSGFYAGSGLACLFCINIEGLCADKPLITRP